MSDIKLEVTESNTINLDMAESEAIELSIVSRGITRSEADERYIQQAGDTMTGKLVLNAGTTTEAPLNMTEGDLLSTPDKGAIEYNKTLTFTPAADRRSIALANGVVLEDATVSNTTTETTIYTESVSANEFYKGAKWHVNLSGHFSTANANDTFAMRIKVGGDTVITLNSVDKNTTNGFFRAEFFFTVRSTGATGSIQAAVESVFDDEVQNNALGSPTTVDTTSVGDITATVEWDAADPNNTLTLTQGHTEIFGVEQ